MLAIDKTILVTDLAQEELPHLFLETKGLTRTNTKIVELDRGLTTDLNEPGFYIEEAQMQQLAGL